MLIDSIEGYATRARAIQLAFQAHYISCVGNIILIDESQMSCFKNKVPKTYSTDLCQNNSQPRITG